MPKAPRATAAWVLTTSASLIDCSCVRASMRWPSNPARLCPCERRITAAAAKRRGCTRGDDCSSLTRDHAPCRFARDQETAKAGHLPDLAVVTCRRLGDQEINVGADVEHNDLERSDVTLNAFKHRDDVVLVASVTRKARASRPSSRIDWASASSLSAFVARRLTHAVSPLRANARASAAPVASPAPTIGAAPLIVSLPAASCRLPVSGSASYMSHSSTGKRLPNAKAADERRRHDQYPGERRAPAH